jgi:signal transduction histidine kinase
MLDFAQIKAGKFRMNFLSFNIEEAIEEIVNIQKLKAEFCEIKLSFEMKNFYRSSLVCSDPQRIQ